MNKTMVAALFFAAAAQCRAIGPIEPRLTFRYGGEPVDSALAQKSVREENGRKFETMRFDDGLEVTIESVRHGLATDWVVWWENRGDGDTKRISEVNDCDITVPFEADEIPPNQVAWVHNDGILRLFVHRGSIYDDSEFYCDATSTPWYNAPANSLTRHVGCERRYLNPGQGRSSDEIFPFFNFNKGDTGFILAIGWSGQWKLDASRLEDWSVNAKSGIENLDFYLKPGERIRTSSTVALPYENGYTKAQNDFRRLVKEHYSLIGRPGRPEHAPYSMMLWGGLNSEQLSDRVEFAGRNNLGFEYAWVDAGWYGTYTTPSRNEFEGEWSGQVGDWRIHEKFHPDGFRDFAETVKNNGMKFLLWVEIERTCAGTPVRNEHPDWFHGDLLDLGNPEAWEWAHTILSTLIRDLDIKCYRQDFNMNPLPCWNSGDSEGRAGITQIKHIMGLYRLWDSLLEEFPDLIIDDCASGGRRIDIETVRRSVPLWRSDYQCPANSDPDVAQNHTICLARWLPYHGTSYGRPYGDWYRARSAYTTGMCSSSFWTWDEDPSKLTQEDIEWFRKSGEEYKKVRELMEGDFYPLTDMEFRTVKSTWAAYQFDNPDRGDGVVLAFRRAASPMCRAKFCLGGVDAGKTYVFTDADNGGSFAIEGAKLAADGLEVDIETRRSSKILYYTAK